MPTNSHILPFITVVVPTRNEENYIAKLLDSCVAATYPKEKLEICICDGMSTDNTLAIVNTYCKKHAWIKLLENKNKTTPYAFNLGIQQNKTADIYITVSGHSVLAIDFFENVVNAFALSAEIGCVGGVLQNVFETKQAEAIGMAMSSVFGVGNAQFRTGNHEGYVDTVGFPAYKRVVFEKVGLFNEALTRNQDDEFNYRVTKAGFKIYLSRAIKSSYYVRSSFSKVFKQYYQYGYWKVYVNTIHKTVTTSRQLIPPAFVAFLILGLILSLFSRVALMLYAIVLIAYVVGAVYFAAKQSTKPGDIIKIIYAFFILHLSYGMGYLKGLFDFVVRHKKPAKSAQTLTR